MSAGRRTLHAALLVMPVAAFSNCGGSSDLNTAQGSFADGCPRLSPRRFAAGDSIVLTTVNDYPCTVEFRATGIRLLPDPQGKRPDPGPRVVRDRSGRFFSANATGFSSVVVAWAEDGSFLTALGRPGEGPGNSIRAEGLPCMSTTTVSCTSRTMADTGASSLRRSNS